MKEESRQLRDRIEALQGELKETHRRIDELEPIATEELGALEDQLDRVTKQRNALEADLARADWEQEGLQRQLGQLERELATARAEQQRLKSQLENAQLELASTAEAKRKMALRLEALDRNSHRRPGARFQFDWWLPLAAVGMLAIIALLVALIVF